MQKWEKMGLQLLPKNNKVVVDKVVVLKECEQWNGQVQQIFQGSLK